MARWKIGYYPPPGERDSPFDAILAINDPKEAASIKGRLDLLANLSYHEWSNNIELKPIDKKYRKLLQVTDGNYRIYLSLDTKNSAIIVLYVCRKVSGKAKEKDKNRAIIHYCDYFQTKGK